jgi:hypothetical protein
MLVHIKTFDIIYHLHERSDGNPDALELKTKNITLQYCEEK